MIERGFFHGATHVIQVESGTKITDPRTGSFEFVQQGHIVGLGNNIYMVAEDYDTVLAKLDQRDDVMEMPAWAFSL